MNISSLDHLKSKLWTRFEIHVGGDTETHHIRRRSFQINRLGIHGNCAFTRIVKTVGQKGKALVLWAINLEVFEKVDPEDRYSVWYPDTLPVDSDLPTCSKL